MNEKSSFSKPLSSFVSAYSQNGIVVEDGTKWNAEQYCKNAAFSLQTEGDVSTMTVEVRIPLEDALLSVHTAERDSVRSVIKNQTKSLCGGITTRVDLNEYSCLVTGLPSDHTAIFASEYDTVADWMEREFSPPASGVYIPSVVPIPLYLSGRPPKVNSVPNTSKTTPSAPDESIPGTTPSVTTTIAQDTVPDLEIVADDLTSDLPVDSAENDESIFDSLPDSDDLIPEETEIVYDAKSVTTKSEDRNYSLASNILAAITGALLFASVMVLCLFFRNSNSEKESDKNKGKKKKKQKKNRERD